MTLAKDFASKLAVALVAVAMVVAAFAPAAKAQTSSDDLQAMINDLLSQIATLESQLGGSSSVSSDVCPFTWTRDLSSGSTGADVMKLQQFLNSDADTRVAASGVGSVGAESDYFGALSAAAVSKFQVKYRSEILSPAGLVNPTGYFGPSTRAKANSLCTSAPVVDDGDDDDDMMDDDDDDDDSDRTLRGEASLDNFELDSGESDLEEGESDVVVGEITVEFADGDAEISRLDLALVADTAGTQDENEPWEVFETISLWVDGDMIAEEEIDDEDNFLDEDFGVIRFSGLDIFAGEDDEVEILVAVSAQNNLDGLSDGESWQLFASAIRFFDADGVATTEDSQDDLATDEPAWDDAGNVEFDLEEEGAGEDLDVSLSSSNPDGSDVIVDTDDDTDGVTILVADLEADDNDIELNKVIVRVDVTGDVVVDVVNDVYVVIDGEEFKAEAITGTAGVVPTGNDSAHANGGATNLTSTSTYFVFDIDGDIVLEDGEEVEMEVVVDLDDTNDGARYGNGTSIEASITSTELAEWDAEGANDVTPSGSAVGDEHVLVAEGILVPSDGFDYEISKVDADGKVYQFQLDFEVTAVEDDFYIFNNATTSGTNPTTGVGFTVTGGAAAISAALDSTADEDTVDVFTVREGETETFTLTVTVDATGVGGTYRVELDEVHYTDNADGTTGTTQYDVTPASDFRTKSQSIAS